MRKISVFENEQALSKAAADFIVSLAARQIAENGKFTIALSGGNTPSLLFQLLASDDYNKAIQWKNTFVFWGDERCVPPQDERNNSHVAKELLLNHVNIPSENIFCVPVKLSPPRAANAYEQTLKLFFKESIPAFDLILLGMGDNGHTASLFPHTPILHEKTAIVKEVYVKELDMSRVSFTAPLINHANIILFLVAGSNKAAMLHTVLEGKENIEKYPAQMVKGKKVLWYIDKSAAAKLK
ncbi:MAG: 6-phosphogluconolactonase [Bacteroidetes bacterium]|nr:6-phosphogluconolactonase [Bacteroidota bacterium]MBS1757212.1 6-phosphogluconolactonase [Bacteroidota bacterium]